MSAHARFHLQRLAELKAELTRLGLSLPLSSDLSILGDSVALGFRKASSRFAGGLTLSWL